MQRRRGDPGTLPRPRLCSFHRYLTVKIRTFGEAADCMKTLQDTCMDNSGGKVEIIPKWTKAQHAANINRRGSGSAPVHKALEKELIAGEAIEQARRSPSILRSTRRRPMCVCVCACW